MKKIILLFLITASIDTFSQNVEKENNLRTQDNDTVLGWKKGGLISIGLSQTSLTNWVAGGQSSVSINSMASLFAHKKTKKALWENYLDLGYGLLHQGKKNNWIKTDDRLEFTTKYGYKIKKSLYFAALGNFKTQFTNGYNYPDDSTIISRFMAPGYLLGAIGIDYKPNDNFSLFIAPLTSKTTFVNDQKLADAGAFGVEKARYDSVAGIYMLVEHGNKVRSEFGGYLRMFYKKEIMKNVTFQTKLDLFSNYLNNPQNIDINWETLISLKVNKYISASIATQLIYDNDIMIGVDNNGNGIIDEVGPRTQFKQVLNVGFSYKF